MAFSDTVFEEGLTVLEADLLNSLCDELKDIEANLGKTHFPVGSIFITESKTSPASFIGGTWEQISQGRFLIGAGSGTDAESVQKTFEVSDEGGSYNLEEHSHNLAGHTHTATCASAGSHTHANATASKSAGSGSKAYAPGNSTGESAAAGDHTHTVTISSTGQQVTEKSGTGSNGNLPPYRAVYIWKRTA